MENRFGLKDLFVFAMLLGLIAIVFIAMKQFDRQYQEVLSIKRQQQEMVGDIVSIARKLDQGVATIGQTPVSTTQSSATSASNGPDAFTDLRAAEKMPDFARGDWFIDNFGTKIGKLTPLLATDVYQRWCENLVVESLAVRDARTLEYVPRLATRWDVSDDGLTMRFYLRQGVTFSDGTPLTADDVVFTFDFIRNPDVDASRTRAYLTMLKDVKKIDDYTVEFTYTEPYFLNFETAAGMGIMSKAFYGRFAPADFNQKVGLLFGSGPYRLDNPETWAPGTPVVLYRNQRYWGPAATFNRIYFQEIQEEAAQMVLYGNREHDAIYCTPEVFDKLKADQRVMSFSNALEYQSPYRGYNYIGWNQKLTTDGVEKPTPFADKRVRQAMTMLIDRERLLKEIFKGYGSVASGPFAVTGKQSDSTIKPLPYNVEKAKELLREAGYFDRNGDGIVDSPDGKSFKFTVLYPSGADLYEKIILFFRDSFSQAGIVMESDRQDWPVLVDRLNKSNFEAVTLGWSTTPESDPYQIFHSSQIKDEGDNRIGYINLELDKLIDEARRTVDVDARMKIWNQVHQTLHEDQPYTFLVNRPYLRLMDKRIRNVERAAIGLNFEYLNGGVIPWYVPTAEQKHQQ